MTESVTIYGIANCDTIKKAKQWLTQRELAFQFHDYRKQGLDPTLLRNWVDELGWGVLINKRGTTWRQLSDLVKNNVDKESAIAIMLDNPAIIKRPLLVKGDERHVGFSDANYNNIFESH
ncbi:MAG: arsenate reductase [Urechidicola sp.]|jgi:Spx/MgsR family transcriptional regulator